MHRIPGRHRRGALRVAGLDELKEHSQILDKPAAPARGFVLGDRQIFRRRATHPGTALLSIQFSGGDMANPFVMRAEAITNCTEDLQRHIDAYAAYTPNNDKAQGKLALVVIADLQKKLEELQRRLKVALD
jgi:hypothetical protein